MFPKWKRNSLKLVNKTSFSLFTLFCDLENVSERYTALLFKCLCNKILFCVKTKNLCLILSCYWPFDFFLVVSVFLVSQLTKPELSSFSYSHHRCCCYSVEKLDSYVFIGLLRLLILCKLLLLFFYDYKIMTPTWLEGIWIHWLYPFQRGKTHQKRKPWEWDKSAFHGEAPIWQIWRMWSTRLLLLFRGPFWSGVVVLINVLSMCWMYLFENY